MYLHVHYRKYAPSLVLKIIPPYWITNYYTDSHKNLSSWVAGFRELKTSSSRGQQHIISGSLWQQKVLPVNLCGNRKQYCHWIPMATERISLGSLWEEKLLSLDPQGNKKYCPWIPMAREVIVLGSLWQEKLLSLDPYGKRSYCPWIPMAIKSIVLGSL